MEFKARLRKIGNGMHIYIPQEVYTKLEINGEYEWEVYTKEEKAEKNGQKTIIPRIVVREKVITPKQKKMEWCNKHNAWKSITCKCK